MIKLSRPIWKHLRLIALTAIGFCLIIGISWVANHPVARTLSLPNTVSPTFPNQQPSNQNTVKTPDSNSITPASPPDQGQNLIPDTPQNNVTSTTKSSIQPQVEPSSTSSTSTSSDNGLPNTSAPQPSKTFSVPSKFQGKIIDNVSPANGEKVIALTFDDGPWHKNTLQMLEVLKKNNVKATFFWLGQILQEYPEIAKAVVAEGHAIGNHTWSHSYRQMNKDKSAKEIDDTAALIYKTTGVETLYFRPPGGILTNGVADYAKKKNYAIVKWSNDPMDYRPLPADKLVANVLRKAKSGDIVLMHDGGGNHSATLKAVPQIITKLKQLGYKFVTVPELLEMNK